MSQKLGNSLNNEQIVKLYNENLSLLQISKMLQVSRSTIRHRLTSMGIKIRDNSHYTKLNITIDPIRLNEIGKTRYAKELGTSSSVLNRLLDISSETICWDKIEEDIKKYLEETRSYKLTSQKFNIPQNKLSAKNNRSWGIQIKKSLDYTREQIKNLLIEHKNYDIVSDITGIKYNSLKSMNAKIFHIDIRSKSNIGKYAKDFIGVTHRSMFETKIANYLILSGIKFEHNKRLTIDRKWTCDFYLPDDNIYLECDGLGSNRSSIDRNYDEYLNKLAFYKENNLKLIITTSVSHFRTTILPLLTKQVPTISFSNIVLREIGVDVANIFAKQNHYKGSIPKNSCYRLGYFLGNILCGIITFGPGPNKDLIRGIAGEDFSGIELTRLCALDSIGRNFESFMIGMAFKFMRDKVDILVSFADPFYKHVGIIYQATNWIYTGTCAKDYMYRMPDGQILHKSKFRRTLDKSEKQLAEERGAIKFEVPGKHRYIYILNKKKRKEILSKMSYEILDYPKSV